MPARGFGVYHAGARCLHLLDASRPRELGAIKVEGFQNASKCGNTSSDYEYYDGISLLSI